MDYVDAATINILSPDILTVEELRNMLRHMEPELPSTMHLPISSDDRHPSFLLVSQHKCIDSRRTVPTSHSMCPSRHIAQQLQIYEVLNSTSPTFLPDQPSIKLTVQVHRSHI